MTRSPDHLYELLPAAYRMRDAEQGYPLRALLHIINEQVELVEDDIARLYDNWFIETCEDWVVPYIGDLIGYRPVHEAGDTGDVASSEGRARNRFLIPRRDVADALGFRRRKGTLPLLELLARDVAGWPARAVEFYPLLGWAQHAKFVRSSRGRTCDVRDGDALDRVDGPFERLAHTVNVRRVVSHRSMGRYNLPSVGLFVWRLRPYSITHAPAYCLESEGSHCFTFSVLGNDAPLHTRPEPESVPTHIADEINLPVAIRRRALEERVGVRPLRTRASASYYGEGRSIAIYAPDWPSRGAPQPLPPELIVPADLSLWRYRAPRGHVAIDPVLGRIVFPSGQLPRRGVWVGYHYAFSADMGGGEYRRSLTQPVAHSLYRVGKPKPWEQEAPSTDPNTFKTVNEALAKWRSDQHALGPEPADPVKTKEWLSVKERLRSGVIEIVDSAVYSEQLAVRLEQGESLQIRAASGTRPVIRLLDYLTDQPDAFSVSGKRGSRFKLDGLLVTGRGIQVRGPDRGDAEALSQGDLCDVTIRHCTLVPGWGLECNCEPKQPNEPSLELINTAAKIVIEDSIVGSIYVTADEVQTDPVAICISDSIVDATSVERVAIGAPNLPRAFAHLTILRTTVIGEVNAHAIVLADNSIFMSVVHVARRQLGCVRFCYVTPGSRTPRRYHCQTELAEQAIEEAVREARRLDNTTEPDVEVEPAKERERQRVRPLFTSTRYGTPAYCQLADDCAQEVKRGADDESEIGAFHDLFQPQRAANLRARLDDYTPAGIEAGTLFAT